MTRALVVVDVQRDFVEGGSLAVAGGQEVSYKIADAIRNLKGKSGIYEYFVATKDFHSPHSDNGGHFGNPPDYVDTWPAHCVQGTEGSLFAPGVAEVAELFDAVFYKGKDEPAYSGFQGKRLKNQWGWGYSLHDYLQEREVTGLTICGIATDYCVKATALDAIALGYDVRIPARLTVAVGGEDAKTDAILDIYAKARKDTVVN